MVPKPLIMVVEHNQRTQDILRMDLEALGYKILSVLTTEEAWRILEEGTNPDVMVLGFYFPGEDGPAFYRRLARNARFSEMIVIPLTSQSHQETQGPRGIFTNIWQEDINKTPPQLIININQALRQKKRMVRVWTGLKKRLVKFKLKS